MYAERIRTSGAAAPALINAADTSLAMVCRYSGDSLRRASIATTAPGVTLGSTSPRNLVQKSSTSHGTSSVSSITGVAAVIDCVLIEIVAPCNAASSWRVR